MKKISAPLHDDLSDIARRADEALDQEYAEDRDCMGQECLAMVEELRQLRIVAKAAKRLYKTLCEPSTPIDRAETLFQVRTALHANRKRRPSRAKPKSTVG